MLERRVRVYTGTTLQNFLQCAVPNGQDSYLYDKTREPRHRYPQTYFVLDSKDSFGWAIGHAVDIGEAGEAHVPAVLSGEIPASHANTYSLPPGEMLVVDRILLPDPDKDWKAVNPEVQRTLFVAHSPTKVLVDFGKISIYTETNP